MYRCLFFSILLVAAFAAVTPVTPFFQTNSDVSGALWFTQKLDHFNNADLRTFQQRYYLNERFYDGHGPIILYIGGEGPLTAPPADDSFIGLLAQNMSGLIAALEHRYYGKTQPFRYQTTENLQYLSSHQALYDLANFIQTTRDEIRRYNPLADPQFMVVGGSYPGALAGWFCTRFQHLVKGCYSSSGVVNAILDFTTFDNHIRDRAGSIETALKTLTNHTDHLLATEPDGIKSDLAAEGLMTEDMYYLIADSIVMAIQYSAKSKLVDYLSGKTKASEIYEAYLNYMKDLFYPNILRSTAREYDRSYMQITDTEENELMSRTWWYQKCTGLAYWQVAPSEDSIRSTKIDHAWHVKRCNDLFGEGHAYPQTREANIAYGGAYPTGRNVVYVNAADDPWWMASVADDFDQPESISLLANCDDCGHCIDLHNPSEEDPQALKDVRDEVKDTIYNWFF